MSLLATVHECVFLRPMPTDIIRRLEEIGEPRDFAPGAVIFTEGSTHHDLYLILQGIVRLDMSVPQRGRVPVMTLGAGDLLGWSPLVGDSVMTTSAVAMEYVSTAMFNGEELRQLCESDHEIGYHVMRQVARSLSRRLLATRLQLLDLFAAPVPSPGRVISAKEAGDEQC